MRSGGINPRIHNLGYVEIYDQVHAPVALPPGKSPLESTYVRSTAGLETLGKKSPSLPGVNPRFHGLAAHRLARILTQTSILVIKGF
jgi:hypothetical protein